MYLSSISSISSLRSTYLHLLRGATNTMNIEKEIKRLDKTSLVRKRDLLERLFTCLQELKDEESPLVRRILDLILDIAHAKPKTITIPAGTKALKFLTKAFGLTMEWGKFPYLWEMNADILLPVPKLLLLNLKNWDMAEYDISSEASFRIRIDYIIVACQLEYLKQYGSKAPTATDDTSTSSATTSTTEQRKHGVTTPPPLSQKNQQFLTVFPELDIYVEVEDRRVNAGSERLRIMGRADWAFGHGERNEANMGTVLVAVEAKKQKNLSEAQDQLLTYLAIIRKLRQQQFKKNYTVQGFYSDGIQYCFVCIRQDGRIFQSRYYSTRHQQDLLVIYNWVIQMLISSSKSSLTSSPTKPGKEQNVEVNDYENQVLLRVCHHGEEEKEEPAELEDIIFELTDDMVVDEL